MKGSVRALMVALCMLSAHTSQPQVPPQIDPRLSARMKKVGEQGCGICTLAIAFSQP